MEKLVIIRIYISSDQYNKCFEYLNDYLEDGWKVKRIDWAGENSLLALVLEK